MHPGGGGGAGGGGAFARASHRSLQEVAVGGCDQPQDQVVAGVTHQRHHLLVTAPLHVLSADRQHEITLLNAYSLKATTT